MKKIALATLLVSLTSTAALAEAEFHPSTYTTYKQHAPHSGEVGILQRFDDRQHIEIGLVRVPTERAASYEQALFELKQAAARYGSTAIVLEDDARIYSAGGVTPRGTKPVYATAIAVIPRSAQ